MAVEKTKADQALAAFRRYKGKCNNCGKFGHKTNECRSKPASQKKGESVESKNDKKEKKTERNTSNILCFNCGEMGHFQSKCPKAKSKKGTAKQVKKEVDTVLMTVQGTKQPHDNIWIADSTTSTHITNSEAGLYDIRLIRKPVKISDGTLVYVTKVGKMKVRYSRNDKEHANFVLENVQYILDFWVNLFSLTAVISKGCRIFNEERAIVVEKDALRLTFNEEIKTQNGYVCGIELTSQIGQ